jgi:CBS domain-containing protein
MSNKSAATLLKVVESASAGDVLHFNKRKKALGLEKNRSVSRISADSSQKDEHPEVIVIDSKLTPLEAATLLWENNIMGAPVYDQETEEYVGMFDTRDILSCVIDAHREFIAIGGHHHSPGEDTHVVHDVDIRIDDHKTRRDLIAKALQHIKVNAKPPSPGAITVTYLAARNPMTPFMTNDSPLLDVCKVLECRQKHRVPITDSSSGKRICTGIITQSGLVAFIASKCPPGSLDVKMSDAGLEYKKTVVKIVDTASASDAFELLDSKRLSGIAVVDEDGKLIGNTSARDIKNAVMDAGRTNMELDILSYLAHVRQSQLMLNDKYPSCHVHEDATVAHVVNLLAKTGYHRVFVVDEDMKPVGVVSFADIIKFFIEKGNE